MPAAWLSSSLGVKAVPPSLKAWPHAPAPRAGTTSTYSACGTSAWTVSPNLINSDLDTAGGQVRSRSLACGCHGGVCSAHGAERHLGAEGDVFPGPAQSPCPLCQVGSRQHAARHSRCSLQDPCLPGSSSAPAGRPVLHLSQSGSGIWESNNIIRAWHVASGNTHRAVTRELYDVIYP